MPRVSVVIPNFNYARFLDLRLRSVLDQTFQDFEVIYLDDASSDGSDEVIARYASDRRIRIVRNKVNSGSPFKQWNRGVREAKGEYIWIAEADDHAAPRLLETLVDRLDQNSKAGLAYCESYVIDEEGKTLHSARRLLEGELDVEHWRADFVSDGKAECARYLLFKNTIPNASAVVFRRSVYEKAGGADESMRLCGDWLTWVNMLLISDLAFVAEPLNFHRIHPNALRQRTSLELSATEGWKVMERILDEVQPSPTDVRKLEKRLANEWASVTVLQHKRTFDAGLARFRQLGKHDRFFALHAGVEVVSYALKAARKRILRAMGRSQDA